MSERFEISFAPLNADPEEVTVILAGDGLELGSKARELETKSASAISKAAAAADYKGKYKSTIEILAPAKLSINRLIVAGLGKDGTLTPQQYVDLGGAILGAIQARKTSTAGLIVDVEGSDDLSPEQIAGLLARARCFATTASRNIRPRNPATTTQPTRTASASSLSTSPIPTRPRPPSIR